MKLCILNESHNIYQDEDLIFPVLDSDFDNSIMQTQSLTSELNFTEKSSCWVLTNALFEISHWLSFLSLMNDLDDI